MEHISLGYPPVLVKDNSKFKHQLSCVWNNTRKRRGFCCWPGLSAPDWPLRGLTPNWLILCFRLTDVLHPLFRARMFSRAQLFMWSSRQNRQKKKKKVFWTLQCRFKDIGDKIPSLATYLRTHTQTHTNKSIYIYIYIYTYTYATYGITHPLEI